MTRFLNIIFISASLLISLDSVSQDIFDFQNSKKFAEYLKSTQQFSLASHEYERMFSLRPDDTVVFSNLIYTYRMTAQCETSFKNLQSLSLSDHLKTSSIATEFLNLSLSCNCCFNKSDFENALLSVSANKQVFYRLGKFVIENKLDSALIFSELNKNTMVQFYPELILELEHYKNMKHKSPSLAIAMSAILPGSGKAYCNRWGDAFMSLLFVSTNAWIAYRGFNKQGVKSISGWIFGSLSVSFYLGNLWGSHRVAKVYNQTNYDNFYSNARKNIYNRF